AQARHRLVAICRRRRDPRARRHVDQAEARRPDRLHRMDARRASAPPALPRLARRQGGQRRGARVMNVEISHPDKELFSAPKVTKRDLAAHYDRVAPAMLPLVRGRPLALQVFPAGVAQRGFFLKNVPGHFPDWIARVTVPKKGGSVTHVVADNADTLVYLAGQ